MSSRSRKRNEMLKSYQPDEISKRRKISQSIPTMSAEDTPAEPAAAAAKTTPAVSVRAAARRKFTARGKRGGQKHKKKADKHGEVDAKAKEAASEHARKIAQFHALEKRIAAASSAEERQTLLKEQDALGGLQEYQQASLHGARHGESSKWLVTELEKRHGRRETRLLDVGAIAGTSYKKYTSIKPTYIDLNPQAEHVIKADFRDYPVPEQPFDVVCLSLVLNFVGSIDDRVQILRRAHKFLKPEGYLYTVLPRACVSK